MAEYASDAPHGTTLVLDNEWPSGRGAIPRTSINIAAAAATSMSVFAERFGTTPSDDQPDDVLSLGDTAVDPMYYCSNITKHLPQIVRRIEQLERQVANKLPAVAFSAGIEAPDPETRQVTYLGGEKIMFNQVHTNVGEWYDPETCVFKCHRRGLYQFSLSVRASDPDHEAWVELVKDGRIFKRVHVNRLPRIKDSVPDVGLCGSCTDFVVCEAGQMIWVQAGSWDSSRREVGFFCGLAEEAYTSFSGMLVSVMEAPAQENHSHGPSQRVLPAPVPDRRFPAASNTPNGPETPDAPKARCTWDWGHPLVWLGAGVVATLLSTAVLSRVNITVK